MDENKKIVATYEAEPDNSIETEHNDDPKYNASALVKWPIVPSTVNDNMDESETIEPIKNDEPFLIDSKTATQSIQQSSAISCSECWIFNTARVEFS